MPRRRQVHINPSDVYVTPYGGMFGGGYSCHVESINTEQQVERCQVITDLLQERHHLIVDVYDFEYMGYLIVDVHSHNQSESDLQEWVAEAVNEVLNQ